jgi:hypothetical protein
MKSMGKPICHHLPAPNEKNYPQEWVHLNSQDRGPFNKAHLPKRKAWMLLMIWLILPNCYFLSFNKHKEIQRRSQWLVQMEEDLSNNFWLRKWVIQAILDRKKADPVLDMLLLRHKSYLQTFTNSFDKK